jgi:putative intracellular protease/amidase
MHNPSIPSKPKALIVISSATVLPLAEPAGHPGISTGFFLVEMGQILKAFGDDYEFTFATPDGHVPQLDINGMALALHAIAKSGSASISAGAAQAVRFNVDKFRAKRIALIDRRVQEMALAHRHLGRLPVSDVLPNTDKEVALLHDDLVKDLDTLPERTYLSAEQLVRKHRDPEDPFTLAGFDFMHMPGGHAPMVDFADNPWLGELLNTLHENGVLISQICHAPIAMASAKYRVREDGTVATNPDHAFKGARLTTVPKHGEIFALAASYPKVPGKKTRVTYYVDEALKDAGYDVQTATNPSTVKVVWDDKVRLLTGNGPHAMDDQAAQLLALVSRR